MSVTNTSSDDKWFTVYVPAASGNSGGTQSYFRIGSPDTTTESNFLSTLRTTYGSSSDPGVKAAFDQMSTSGMVLYTAGDVVQFINGTSDTRILNDRYVVHVLNKDTTKAAKDDNLKADDQSSTYRTYFRLGKPYDVVEGAMLGIAPDDKLEAFVRALAPALVGSEITDAATKKTSAQNADTADARTEARTYLSAAAERGDTAAIDAIGDLLAGSVNGTDAQKAEAKDWARTTLQALHLKFANTRKREALYNTGDGRTKLRTQAKDESDPVARRKIIEISEVATTGLALHGTVPGVESTLTVEKVGNAKDWALTVLKELPKNKGELLARFSHGSGVALYSDRPINFTTPDKMSVTVGADARSVLGETFSEVYDCSDDIISKIKDGTITTIDQVSDKKLVTATLVARDSTNTWRNTTLDRSKSIGFKVGDYGSCELSMNYAFAAGLKFANGLAASLDATVGLGIAVSAAAKVECTGQNVKTSWPGGEISFEADKEMNAENFVFEVDSIKNTSSVLYSKRYALGANIVMGVMNVLALAYAARAGTVGSDTSHGDDTSTDDVRSFLEDCGRFYLTAAALNTIMLAAGIVVGIVQIVLHKTAQAQKIGPTQKPNITMNSGGIKIQVGANYLEVNAAGITISGTTIKHNSPLTLLTPAPVPSPATPTSVVAAVAAVTPAPGSTPPP
jgi:hypothetical protein